MLRYRFYNLILKIYNNIIILYSMFLCLSRSSLTYKQHRAPVTAVAILENSHSVVTGSEDGCIHVWRVDATHNTRSISTAGELLLFLFVFIYYYYY